MQSNVIDLSDSPPRKRRRQSQRYSGGEELGSPRARPPVAAAAAAGQATPSAAGGSDHWVSEQLRRRRDQQREDYQLQHEQRLQQQQQRQLQRQRQRQRQPVERPAGGGARSQFRAPRYRRNDQPRQGSSFVSTSHDEEYARQLAQEQLIAARNRPFTSHHHSQHDHRYPGNDAALAWRLQAEESRARNLSSSGSIFRRQYPYGAYGNYGGRHGDPTHLSLAQRDIVPEDYETLLALDDVKSKGLTEGDLSLLPVSIGCGNGSESCAICLEKMEQDQLVTRLPPCLHQFHTECVNKWLERSATCPIDKLEVDVKSHSF